jgi:ketosteroid isomerase-like protein
LISSTFSRDIAAAQYLAAPHQWSSLLVFAHCGSEAGIGRSIDVAAHIEIVREGLARFSAGDFEGTLALIDEDAVWEPSGQFVGSGEEYRGHQGIRRFWAAFTEPWEEIKLIPTEAIALDEERVLTDTLFRGIGRASGIQTETHLIHLWTVRGHKITRFQSFPTRAEALDAARQ